MRLLLIVGTMAISAMGQLRCPSTISQDNRHTFILAALTDKEIENREPEALYKEAAEACYKDCNAAEIMAFSTSYWKHRSPMTILDHTAKFLIQSDFFQMNDTYFVNHIAIENEGPIGLGCFALETPSEFSLYPLDDPICSSTRSVVCGMPSIRSNVDSQKVADAIHALDSPPTNNSTNSSDTVNPDDGKNNHTVVHLASGINLAEMIAGATSSDGDTNANHLIENAGAEGTEEEKDGSPSLTENESGKDNFSTGDLHYNVIRLSQSQPSPSSASLLCSSNNDTIGSLYSSSIPQFSSWIQRTYPSAKIIIESWNGDTYGAKDSQCLMFSSSQGVHLGKCTDASTVLCEED